MTLKEEIDEIVNSLKKTKQKHYKNLCNHSTGEITIAQLYRLYREIAKIKQSLPTQQITWNNSKDTLQRINQLGAKDYICWIGHATYLLQLNNTRILIDPFFSEAAGPFGFGPKRFIPPAITIENLPPINYILITHNHYDHMDKSFLQAVPNKNNIHVIVPVGLENILRKWGYKNITPLHWLETFADHEIGVTALPAYHYSKRGLFDYNKTWWCSYRIQTHQHNIFHSGDTAYGKVFKHIGENFGPFDYVMLGIGAYLPKEILQKVHTDPKEALTIAMDLKANCLLPMHWGTIVLSAEPIDEPIKKLFQYIDSMNTEDRIGVQLTQIGDVINI